MALPVLRVLAWLACVVYSTIPAFWLAIHPFVGYWRSRRRSPHRVLVPLWMATWVIVGAITWPWRGGVLYTSWWAWLPALALFGCGFWIYHRAKQDFSTAQLSGVAEIRHNHPDQRLITSGLRARIRHPVYLGHLCEMLAWSIGSGMVALYGLTIFAMITGAIMIRMEEAELAQRFGEAYGAYRRRVPAVLPTFRTKPADFSPDSPGSI
jgi:protein-S-isoprenylcysteine O-methyltransferase Ste14